MVNDGIGNGNFTTLKPFAFWTQHVLPLVYGDEISYMETLGKMRDILNELIKNNNNLPDYIKQMIEAYISSGAIEEVIDNVLANFILNVKFPPTGIPKAKGDGTTNDHGSIQGCIDYAAANGGGIVYLPAGKYLTSPLVLKSGVTLLGFGRYAVSLVLAGGATTHLITGTVSDAGLLNLTMDAKMSSQVNRVDAVELIGNHIDIRSCLVRDCYTSINVQKDGTAVNICDVICEVASDACLRIGGTNGGLLVNGLDMTGLSTNLGTAYIVSNSNGDIYRNINIHGTGAIGIDVSGSGNYFDGKISGVTKDYDDISGDNTFNLFGKTRVENLTGEVVENANAFSHTAVNGIERQGANISDNAVNTHTINAKDVVINPTNPLTYKTPLSLNDTFNYITFKNSLNEEYKILVYKKDISSGLYKDIKDYGATGDGVTDDTNAIQTAINENTYINFSAGTYKITNTINISSECHIIGVGTILENLTAPTGNLELRGVFNILSDNTSISGLKFTGSGVTKNNLAGIITVVKKNNVTISNCVFNNCKTQACVMFIGCNNGTCNNNTLNSYGYTGISLYNGSDSDLSPNKNMKIYDNYLGDSTVIISGNNYGITLGGGNFTAQSTISENCSCFNNIINLTLPLWTAIDSHGGKNISIHDNIILNCGVGISMFANATRGFTVNNGKISNNLIIGSTTHVTADTDLFTIPVSGENISVTDNVIYNGGKASKNIGAGACSIAGKNIIVANNTFYNSKYNGIAIYCELFNVSNNIINKVENDDASKATCILVQGNGIITGNTFLDYGTAIQGTNSKPSFGMYCKLSNNYYGSGYSLARTTYLVTESASTAPTEPGVLGDFVINNTVTTGGSVGWVYNGTSWIAV